MSQQLRKGTIRLTVKWPEDDLDSLLIRGRIPHSATFLRIDQWRRRVQRRNDVTFDADQLPYGMFTARVVVVQRETGKLAGQVHMLFRKLPYRANEVCLSPQGWTLVRRQPCVPFVASLSAVPKGLDPLAEAGFDAAILPSHQLPSPPAPLRLIPSLPSTGPVDSHAKPIGNAASAPALLGWHTTRSLSPEEFQRFVDLCPYHPLIATVPASRPRSGYEADIVCVAADTPGKGQSLDYAAWAKAVAAIAGEGRAVWASVPAAAAPGAARMAAYLALTSGAKGIVWPVDPALDKAKNWSVLREAAAEVALYRMVFLRASATQVLEPRPSGKLRAAAYVHQGRTYVFVANPGPETLQAQVPIATLQPGCRLWVAGEKRTVQLDAARVLRDTLKPLDAHVYTTRPGA